MKPKFKVLYDEIGNTEYRLSLKEATLVCGSEHINLDQLRIECSSIRKVTLFGISGLGLGQSTQ